MAKINLVGEGLPVSEMPVVNYKGSLLVPVVDITQPAGQQNKAMLLSSLSPAGSAAVVTSFNGRGGAVILEDIDVVDALSYIPVNPANAIFTKVPTSPTPELTDNSNSLATTAFVVGLLETNNPVNYQYINSVVSSAGAITSGSCVSINANDTVSNSDQSSVSSVSSFLGIATQSGNPGSTIQIVTSGLVVDTGWNLNPNSLVFLGTDSSITNVAPVSGLLLQIGTAVSNNSIFIRPSSYIQL